MIPIPLWAYGAAALVVAASGFAAGVKVTSNHWQAKQLAAERLAASLKDAEAERGNIASQETEHEKERILIVTQTVTKLVDRIVDRPVYRNVCLDDDGLRAANAALDGQAPDPGQPDGGLPAPVPAR